MWKIIKQLKRIPLTNRNIVRSLNFNACYFLSKTNKKDNGKYSEDLLQQLKKQAKTFYETQVEDQNEPIFELVQTEQWDTEVAKSTIPVVLDCYATWCEPCKQLTPFLEGEAKKAGGKWKLVKVDIDKHPKIASALQLSKVPTVILVVNGNAMDGFTGIPDKNKLDGFFKTLETFVSKQKQSETDDTRLKDLQEKLEVKDTKGLNEKLKELNSDVKFARKNYVVLSAFKAWVMALESNTAQALEIIKEIEEKYDVDFKASQPAQELVNGCKEYITELQNQRNQNNKLQQMLKQLDKTPEDLNLRFDIAQYCNENELFDDSIKHFLNIIAINRTWSDRKAQQHLLKLFEKLGSANTLVIQGRKKLGALLY